MSAENRLDVVRDVYRAYETGEREVVERRLAEDFVFFSPPDPGIDRAAYFERCWPNSGNLEAFEFVRLAEIGEGEVLVTYEARRADGTRFRNTEILGFEADQLARVEVYFGWELE